MRGLTVGIRADRADMNAKPARAKATWGRTRQATTPAATHPLHPREINHKFSFCFILARGLINNWAMQARIPLPKSVAQLTGVLVTGIVAFGTDLDVYYAVPLGIFAGSLAVFFVSMSEAQGAYGARWNDTK